ncbi:hypothetical protein GQ600_8090 [Phytophthora cactorum]|nr:hypothetical protein GQ600_8090 [Phytophthora cactorum]
MIMVRLTESCNFSLGSIVTNTNLKELLYRSWWRGNRVAALSNAIPISPKLVKVKTVANKSGVKSSKLTIEPTSCNQVSYFETEFRQHDQ